MQELPIIPREGHTHMFRPALPEDSQLTLPGDTKLRDAPERCVCVKCTKWS